MTGYFWPSLIVDLESPCHAYFSAEAARLYGTGIWEDKDGKEVEVTCVDPDKTRLDQMYTWKDRVYVGMVQRWLREGKQGECQFKPIYLPYLPEPSRLPAET